MQMTFIKICIIEALNKRMNNLNVVSHSNIPEAPGNVFPLWREPRRSADVGAIHQTGTGNKLLHL